MSFLILVILSFLLVWLPYNAVANYYKFQKKDSHKAEAAKVFAGYILAGIIILEILVYLESQILNVQAEFLSLPFLPVLIILGYLSYGLSHYRPMISAVSVGAAILASFSLAGSIIEIISGSGFDVSTFYKVPAAAIIGAICGFIGGAVKKKFRTH